MLGQHQNTLFATFSVLTYIIPTIPCYFLTYTVICIPITELYS